MLNASVPSEKINLGLPFYGYCHDLSNPNNTAIGAATKGPCIGGSVTGQQGTVLYSQVGQRGPLFFVARAQHNKHILTHATHSVRLSVI